MIKNAIVYKLTEDFTLDIDALTEATVDEAYREPTGMELERTGWQPYPNCAAEGGAVLSVQGVHRMVCRVGKKDIPGAVVRYELEKRLQELSVEGVDVEAMSRKEVAQIKREMLDEMIPKAFVKISDTEIYLMPKDGLVCVATGSVKQADMVTSLLRKTLGGRLGIVTYALPEAVDLRSWFLGESNPAGELSVGNSATLKDEDGGALTLRKRELSNDDLSRYAGDMQVKKLELLLDRSTSFNLSQEGFITAISHIIKDEDVDDGEYSEADHNDGSQAALDQADLLLNTSLVVDLVTALDLNQAT